MPNFNYFPKGFPGCLGGFGITLLAIVLLVMTTHFQLHRDDIGCLGMDGVGYPIAWACNYSGGGSPLSSADKIDEADAPILSPHGFIFDVILYSLPFWFLWYALEWFLHRTTA